MNGVYSALEARANEFTGLRVPEEEIARLRQVIPPGPLDWLLLVFARFPICGVRMAFSIDPRGLAREPRSGFPGTYESNVDHDFAWMRPDHVLFHVLESAAGPAAFHAGFLPVGESVFGGDPYFIRFSESACEAVLYRVYYDWIEPDSPVPVPSEAFAIVARSLEDVIKVAAINYKG